MCEEEKNICVLIIDKMFFKHVFVRFQRCFPFDILISLDCRRNAKKKQESSHFQSYILSEDFTHDHEFVYHSILYYPNSETSAKNYSTFIFKPLDFA